MPDQKIMSQKDRQELRRILKARYEILHQQLAQRQQEVQNSLAEKIREEHEAAILKAIQKTNAFEKRLSKIAEEAKALTTEMRALGVVPGNGRSYRGYADPETFLSYSLETAWSPKDLQEKVNQAYSKITEQAGLHKLDLRMQQLELEEELAIGALGSEEAKTFLDKIPNLDKLLPMNGNVTAVLEKMNDDEDTLIEVEV